MPLIINNQNVKWNETNVKINIVVPLKSRVDIKTQILITIVKESVAHIGQEDVTFELKKEKAEIWDHLIDPCSGTESYRKLKREEMLKEHEEYLKKELEKSALEKTELKNATVRRQMELDDYERKSVEKLKQKEKEKFMADIRRKEHQLKANKIAEKRKMIQHKSTELPETRKCGVIKVNFTPRVFPTAARESQAAEEKEWLEKQIAAKTSLKLDLDDLAPEEKNPEWLESKAQSMMKKGDFKSAINAFNLAIRMCPYLYSLYMGRAACHLNLRNLHKAIEDSTKAIELLVPPTASNAESRAKAHSIRGTAFKMLELPIQGLVEFEAALKLKPDDEELQNSTETLRNYIGE